MFASVVSKSITAVLSAAVLASVVAGLTAGVPEAKAEVGADIVPREVLIKGDRLAIAAPSVPVPPVAVTGAACSLNAWPNYEPSCQFDPSRSANDVRTIRIIALR